MKYYVAVAGLQQKWNLGPQPIIQYMAHARRQKHPSSTVNDAKHHIRGFE
jgi:hypothetical protein